MSAAVTAGDREAFLTALAGGPLLLPVSPEAAAGLEPVRWATGVHEGQTYVLAFTSAAAIAACIPGQDVRYRVSTVTDLAKNWPDPSWLLAVDPGLPIGTRLPVDLLRALPPPALPVAPGEIELLDAIQAESSEAFMAALLRCELLVPLRPGGAASRDLTDPEFPWWHLPDAAGRPTLPVFTSADRLREVLGDPETIVVSTPQLTEHWPDPSWSVAVNPGSVLSAVLPGDAFRELGKWLVDLRTAMEDELRQGNERLRAEESAPEPVATQPALPAGAADVDEGPDPDVPLTLQLVIPHAYLSAYLETGYDRAAGLVHSWYGPGRDSPLRLYRRLGLLGDGSPFDESDESVAVLRWTPESPAQAEWGQGEPQMESIVVPDGAGIYRLHRDRREELLARFDATARRWQLAE
jgi:hypothetical protein